MTRNIEFNGIILYSRNFQEKDKLVKIFTEQAGKKMFFVRNILRKNNPLQAAILNFQAGAFIGTLKASGLSFLNGAKKVHAFTNIQNDLFKNAYATYILNLADAAIVDHEFDPNLYNFLKITLSLIDQGMDAEIITNIFELQIMNRFGVQLEFEKCVVCGKNNGQFAFSYKHGGIICPNHVQQNQGILPITSKALHLCRLLAAVNFEKIKSINVKKSTKQDLRKFIDALYDEFIGLKLKSKKFIDQMLPLK